MKQPHFSIASNHDKDPSTDPENDEFRAVTNELELSEGDRLS